MIPVSLLQKRRSQLVELMMQNSVLILFAAELKLRNADTEYPFRQESSFWYFTGLDEPQAFLVLRKSSAGVVDEVLYVQDRDPAKETWTGKILGIEGAKACTGIIQVKNKQDFEKDVHGFLLGAQCLYFDTAALSYVDLRKHVLINAAGLTIQSPMPLIRTLRLYKDSWEIEQMRQAAAISIHSHRKAIQHMRQRIQEQETVWEYEVTADLNHAFLYEGAWDWAYPPIVASGNNACILHYTQRLSELVPGQLVLVDAGCEYHYYAADITRCYPVSGHFTQAQKSIYELVLQAQSDGIAEIARVGSTTQSFHQRVVRTLTQGLVDLGLLSGTVETHIEQRAYAKYFMHGAGHFLGLDVHDIGIERDAQGKAVPVILEPTMAITVEPGLYFDSTDETIPEEFRGIGVRIEDDIIKTVTGIENLTQALEKTVCEIELLCQ